MRETGETLSSSTFEAVEKLVRAFDTNLTKRIETMISDAVLSQSALPLPSPSDPFLLKDDMVKFSEGLFESSAAAVLDPTSDFPCDSMMGADDLLSHVTTWPYVRIHGLAAVSLNGCIGTVREFVQEKHRFAVSLQGDDAMKLFKPANLGSYHFSRDDRCARCLHQVNLCAFPACECPTSSTTAQTTTSPSPEGRPDAGN